MTERRIARGDPPPNFLVGHGMKGRPSSQRAIPPPDDMPSGFCECGCGQPTPIFRFSSNRKKGWYKGYPARRLPGHGTQEVGDKHPNWKGGRVLQKSTGYVMAYARDHPKADVKGYVKEHRLVMERVLGRPLLDNEQVHHKNGVKSDNRPENLEVLTTKEHAAIHGPLRYYSPEARARMSDAGKRGAEARWGKRG